MRKIKDAIDLTSGEKVYFRSHALSTYMTDGRTVEDAINQLDTGEGSGGLVSETDPVFSASPAASITEAKKTEWDGKYTKPSDGIPKTDLASAVQTSLEKADTALQSYTEQYKGTVTKVKINGSEKSPDSNGVVDLGTISGGSSSGGSSGGSTTTDTPIELNPSDSLFEITQEGTYILKCTNNKNYEIRVEKKCSIIMGLETGSSYGAITILHPSGMIYWANNNEPVFEDNKMMELSFYPVLTSIGIYSVLGTWASYDAVFVTENYGDYA